MAYTEQQLAELKAEINRLEAALNSGLLSVRHSDGRQVTYQNAKQMQGRLERMQAKLDAAMGKRRRRTFRARQSGRGI